MTVQASLSGTGQERTSKVYWSFRVSEHQEFRDAYESQETAPQRFVVDLGGTSYLDSSALGMLLLLRDHAGGDSADVSIVNCNQDVRKILTISNFEQLFAIQ